MKKNNESSFESKLNRLEEILALLENDNTPLEDMMKFYEEGVTLTRELRTFLSNAELKISELNTNEN
jgi:exodeoxyribonuclease VII small subunit